MWILLGQGNNYFSIFVSIRADDREEQRERGSPLGEPTPSASWERDREKWSISHSRHLHNKDQTPWGGKSQPTGTCQWLREDETHPQPTTCVLCHCTKAISPGSDSLDHNLKFMLLLLSINKLLAKKGMDCESLRSWHWGVRSSPRRSVLNSKRERTEDTWHLHLWATISTESMQSHLLGTGHDPNRILSVWVRLLQQIEVYIEAMMMLRFEYKSNKERHSPLSFQMTTAVVRTVDTVCGC